MAPLRDYLKQVKGPHERDLIEASVQPPDASDRTSPKATPASRWRRPLPEKNPWINPRTGEEGHHHSVASFADQFPYCPPDMEGSMDEDFQYDVFISHSEEDEDIVRKLADRLRKDGLNVWIHEDEPGAGLLSEVVAAGLNASRVLLVAWTRNAKDSEWVKYEVDYFHVHDPTNKEGRILVVKLDKSEPTGVLSPFRYKEWLDNSEKQYADVLKTLTESISSREGDSASIARIYDFFLGGVFNTEEDRRTAELLEDTYPDFRNVLVSNRAFLRRAVTYLSDRGITQYLDIGSGLPTKGNTHEIAFEKNPHAKVVYVDASKYVVEASKWLLDQVPGNNARAIMGDLTNLKEILTTPEVKEMLDFKKPVAVLLVAVLHFISDDSSALSSVADLKTNLAPGSYIAISHGSRVGEISDITKPFGKIYRRHVAPVKGRPRKDILSFFSGSVLVEPGLVPAPDWHPEVPDRYVPPSGLPFANKSHRCPVLVGMGRIE